jgi:hypothetical protein
MAAKSSACLEAAIDLPSFSLVDIKKPALAGPAEQLGEFNLVKCNSPIWPLR